MQGDQARKDHARYRDVNQWKVEVPKQIRDERRIVRGATREVDQQYPSEDRNWGMLFVGAFCFAAVMFVAAFELGLFDWVYELFR